MAGSGDDERPDPLADEARLEADRERETLDDDEADVTPGWGSFCLAEGR